MSSSDRAVVPCGSCHLCCKMMTPLRPDMGDDITNYRTATWLSPQGPVTIIDRESNGDCVYLTDNGCSIWHRAPYSCRAFDCRKLFQMHDRKGRKAAIKSGVMDKAIFDRGRELLRLEGAIS